MKIKLSLCLKNGKINNNFNPIIILENSKLPFDSIIDTQIQSLFILCITRSITMQIRSFPSKDLVTHKKIKTEYEKYYRKTAGLEYFFSF